MFFNIAIVLVLIIAIWGFINDRRMDKRFNRVLTQMEHELEWMKQEDRDRDYLDT